MSSPHNIGNCLNCGNQLKHTFADLFLKNVDEKEITILVYKDGFLPAEWGE